MNLNSTAYDLDCQDARVSEHLQFCLEISAYEHELSKRVLARGTMRIEQAVLFAFEGLDLDSVTQLRWAGAYHGKCLRDLEASGLRPFPLDLLQDFIDNSNAAFVVEESLGRRSDTCMQAWNSRKMASSGVKRVFFGEQVYYVFRRFEGARKELRQNVILLAEHSNLVGVVGQFLGDLSSNDLNQEGIETIARNATTIFVSALDGEGYLACEIAH